MRKVWAIVLGLVLLAGCVDRPASREEQSDEKTVELELDQAGGDASPLEGDGENCLAITPAEDETLSRLSARIDWSTSGSAPDTLHLSIHEVEGSTTRAETTGSPGISASANGIDRKVNVAVQLPEDSDATAENRAITLTYTVEGPVEATGTATCEV